MRNTKRLPGKRKRPVRTHRQAAVSEPFCPERVMGMSLHPENPVAAGPPVQIPADDLRLLRKMASRAGIPERVLCAAAVRSLAGLSRKEIANLVRLYYDLPICVRASEVDV